MGVRPADLPRLFAHYLGEQVTKQAVSHWFLHGGMPLNRYAEIALVVRAATGHQLDFWRYAKASLRRYDKPPFILDSRIAKTPKKVNPGGITPTGV